MARSILEPGLVIDGFLLGPRLHRGGMADIWQVTRPDIADPVIMKVPLLDFESDISMVVGFEVEHMILAEIAGPHVPKLYARGDFKKQPYVVMERVTGPSLEGRRQAAPLPFTEVVSLGRALAVALADLHRQQVIHLDLKPGNVLMREDGTVVLIDFGLSRHLELPDLINEEFHAATGTPDYMAPEQALCIRSDPRSDVYAVGAMLYEFATGRLPFGLASKMAAVRERFWRRAPPPRLFRPDLPEALQEIILKCLEADPSERFASAAELDKALSDPASVEITERGRRATADGLPERMRRRWGAGAVERSVRRVAEAGAHAPPMVVVAVDLRPGLEPLRAAVRDAAAEWLATHPDVRLACVNVMTTAVLAIDRNVDEAGENLHVQRLAALQDWAAPLGRPPHLLTCHVVEAMLPAAGILDFARANHADRLIIGAPASSRALGEVTSLVRAEAPCPVIIVRAKGATGEAVGTTA